MLEAFLVSTGLVALAEIGDKTQLLSLVLAARFRKPWPIVLGIFASTLLNHAVAAGLGAWISRVVGELWMGRIAGISFLVMAAWILVPDKLDDAGVVEKPGHGVFITTAVLFFLAEMGDKTQVATVALAARFHDVFMVAAGTTLGMMLANAPVVLVGEAAAKRLPLKLIRMLAAASFAAIGVWILVAG